MLMASITHCNAIDMAQVKKVVAHGPLNKSQVPSEAQPPANGIPDDALVKSITVYWGMSGLDTCVRSIVALLFQHPDLQYLALQCGGTFTPGTVASIGIQIADRMQQIHMGDIVHRDINLSNFCIGPTSWDGADESATIFLIDRGTARSTRTPEDQDTRVGNRMFMSVAAHKDRPVGPWDELQSVAFMLFRLLVGELPWQNLNSPSKKLEMAETCIMKELASAVDLGVGNFQGFVKLYEYILNRPTRMPNYNLIRDLFNQVLRQVGELNKGVFDWERPENQR